MQNTFEVDEFDEERSQDEPFHIVETLNHMKHFLNRRSSRPTRHRHNQSLNFRSLRAARCARMSTKYKHPRATSRPPRDVSQLSKPTIFTGFPARGCKNRSWLSVNRLHLLYLSVRRAQRSVPCAPRSDGVILQLALIADSQRNRVYWTNTHI